MIVEAKHDDIAALAAAAWRIQCNPETASYPRYSDEGELRAAMLRFLERDGDRVLAFYTDGQLSGAALLMVERDNKYAQTCGIYVETSADAIYGEFYAYLAEHFAGFSVNLGFPAGNTNAALILARLGARLVESSVDLRLDERHFTPQPVEFEVTEVGLHNFNDFTEFWNTQNTEDMYWTPERIKGDLNHWTVYIIYEDGAVAAAFGYAYGDVFFVYDASPDYQRARSLLSAALPQLFASGEKSIVYFIDEDRPAELAAAQAIGFCVLDRYRCYELTV